MSDVESSPDRLTLLTQLRQRLVKARVIEAVIIASIGGIIAHYVPVLVGKLLQADDRPVIGYPDRAGSVVEGKPTRSEGKPLRVVIDVFESVNHRVKEMVPLKRAVVLDVQAASLLYKPPFNVHAHISFEPVFGRDGEVGGAKLELINLVIKHRQDTGNFSDFIRIQNGAIPGFRVLPDNGSGLSENLPYTGCRFHISWDVVFKPRQGRLFSSTAGELKDQERLLVLEIAVLDGKSKEECGLV